MSVVGERFGCRKRAAFGEPLTPVEVVKEGPPRLQKVRVRYLGGEWEGLEEWVPKQRLLVPWEEAKAFLEDERRMLAAVEAAGDVDSLAYNAASLVFDSLYHIYGEEFVLTGWKAIEEDLVLIRPFETAVERLELEREELLSEPYAFVDREGTYKAPFSVGERLAKFFCRRFTRHVLVRVQEEEDELREKILEEKLPFGEQRITYYEKRLEEEKPVFDLVRKWCGQDAVSEFDEVRELRVEIRRLRGLVESTAEWLRDAGHPVKASMLLKEIGIEGKRRGRK